MGYPRLVITATVFNHAGGAGKTSITRDVGFELARTGLRVLLIDLDPQANLTSWLGVQEARMDQTIQRMFDDQGLPEPLEVFGLHLIPSAVDLALVEATMLSIPGAQMYLRQELQRLTDRYDVVLIDSPPSVGQLAILGAAAADRLIVPIPTRQKGLNALPGLNKATSLYRRMRPDLRVALYIPTLYDARRSHDREVLSILRQGLSPLCEPVPERAAVWLDSNMAGEPLGVYQPGSPVHRDMVRVTQDVAQALGLNLKVQA